jgi:hypothetical protein
MKPKTKRVETAICLTEQENRVVELLAEKLRGTKAQVFRLGLKKMAEELMPEKSGEMYAIAT